MHSTSTLKNLVKGKLFGAMLTFGFMVALSPQGQAQTATQAETAIRSYYGQVLERQPDIPGLNHHMNLWRSGVPLQDIRAALAYSPEATNRLNAYYRCILWRISGGDAGGMNHFRAYLASGGTMRGVVGAMLDSQEADWLSSRGYTVPKPGCQVR